MRHGKVFPHPFGSRMHEFYCIGCASSFPGHATGMGGFSFKINDERVQSGTLHAVSHRKFVPRVTVDDHLNILEQTFPNHIRTTHQHLFGWRSKKFQCPVKFVIPHDLLQGSHCKQLHGSHGVVAAAVPWSPRYNRVLRDITCPLGKHGQGVVLC